MTAIDEIVYLLDEAFRGTGIEATNESQSLLANLSTVEDACWRAVPTGGTRTIESVVLHVGSCKVMYDEYAFGPGELDWDHLDVQPWREGAAPRDDAMSWLTRAHERFVGHVRDLRDDELAVPMRTNWGEQREARWLISTILQHDAYHAGEINHIRALLSSDDRWKWG
jgi:DinB superfamily